MVRQADRGEIARQKGKGLRVECYVETGETEAVRQGTKGLREAPQRLPSRLAHSPDWMKLAQ